MSAGEAKPDASPPAVDAGGRRLADADGPGELRQLLLKAGAQIGQTLSQVHAAVIKYQPGGSQGAVSAEWRQNTASLIYEALTQYHALDQQLAQLPLAAFNGHHDLRDELLASLSLIERGLIELAAGTYALGTPAAKVRLEQAANAMRSGHALRLKTSKALGLPT
jgi:hypothetical protein